MYFLYFNWQTRVFAVIPTGVTITPHYDGEEIYRSESKEELIGIAKGLLIARYGRQAYGMEGLRKAARVVDVSGIRIKED